MESSDGETDTRLVNPCIVVKVNEKLFQEHEMAFAKEDWVKANDILMSEWGAEGWLRMFLTIISGSFRKSLATPVNPYHAIALVKPDDNAG